MGLQQQAYCPAAYGCTLYCRRIIYHICGILLWNSLQLHFTAKCMGLFSDAPELYGAGLSAVHPSLGAAVIPRNPAVSSAGQILPLKPGFSPPASDGGRPLPELGGKRGQLPPW